MTQRDNILKELNELNSQLAAQNPVNVYSVPAGYFDGLVAEVMKRIKALEADNAADELAHLSPLLSSLTKQNPYTVPAGYFENLDGQLNGIIHSEKELPPEEETAALSPLLAGLRKENPYQVPQGYFENLTAGIAKENKPQAKVISFTSRKWFRYAAAAVITGVVVLAGFLFLNNGSGNNETGAKVFAKVSKDINKLSDVQKDDLIEFLNTGITGTETVQVNTDNKSKEIKQLLQDVSEEELKDFQEQTEDLEGVLMTN